MSNPGFELLRCSGTRAAYPPDDSHHNDNNHPQRQGEKQ